MTGQNPPHDSRKTIQQKFFHTQLILILTLAVLLGLSGTLINIHFENQKRDRNLQNVADAIAHSPLLIEVSGGGGDASVLTEYLDSLRDSLDDIDVISIVDRENSRLYHSNHELIGTVYDGTLPRFAYDNTDYYATTDSGPSGTQRRAYAAVYDAEGGYAGFVMAIMLMENIRGEIGQTLVIYLLVTLVAVFIELLISAKLSAAIRESLMGFEPDVFSAMYQIRDNILESLDEGVIAVDGDGAVQFTNRAAVKMLGDAPDGEILRPTLERGEKEFNLREQSLGRSDILLDRIPIREEGAVVGAVGILHDRAEYTKLMEDLTGTRYLVDSMRANNHDFTNKLHVILGLIQMEMYDEATAYIENITIVQRAAISRIMHAVSEPAVAALLIGKTARASELNVKFVLREGCHYAGGDLALPAEALVTIIGNLIDNAFDAMNAREVYDAPKELLFGIFSRPGAVLITVDDTGVGIAEGDLGRVFENGWSTKGEGRGTGLYQVKTMVEGLGGTITVESQAGVGTSFSVSFHRDETT